MKMLVNENTLLKIYKMCSEEGYLKLKENSPILKLLKNEDMRTLDVRIEKNKMNNEIEVLDDNDKSLFTMNYQVLLDSLELEG